MVGIGLERRPERALGPGDVLARLGERAEDRPWSGGVSAPRRLRDRRHEGLELRVLPRDEADRPGDPGHRHDRRQLRVDGRILDPAGLPREVGGAQQDPQTLDLHLVEAEQLGHARGKLGVGKVGSVVVDLDVVDGAVFRAVPVVPAIPVVGSEQILDQIPVGPREPDPLPVNLEAGVRQGFGERRQGLCQRLGLLDEDLEQEFAQRHNRGKEVPRARGPGGQSSPAQLREAAHREPRLGR